MEEHLSDSNKKRRIEVAAASPLATLWPTLWLQLCGSHLRAAGQGSQTLSTGSYLCHISRHGGAKGLRLQWEPVSTKSQQVRCGPSVAPLRLTL